MSVLLWGLLGVPVALAVYGLVLWDARRVRRRLVRRAGCPCPVYQECIDYGCTYDCEFERDLRVNPSTTKEPAP